MSADTTRYILAKLAPGGLLLDLKSGRLFNLNASATDIWDRWLEGAEPMDVAGAIAERHRLPMETALKQVIATLAARDGASPPPSEYLYERSPGGYTFSRQGVPILQVERTGTTVGMAGASSLSGRELRGVLLAISPKLLALRGQVVLHASAVVFGGQVTAFSGESGAGKTTTARSLGRAGAQTLCEDKLVLVEVGEEFRALVGVEEQILSWSHDAAERLAAGERASCATLDGPAEGSAVQLRDIGFIEAERRVGDSMIATALSPVDLTAALFRNSFYGSDVADAWRRHFEIIARLGKRILGYSLVMPAGLEPLDTACRDLARRGSLRSL